MLIYQGFQDTQTSATLLAYLHVKFPQRCLGRFSPNPDFFLLGTEEGIKRWTSLVEHRQVY